VFFVGGRRTFRSGSTLLLSNSFAGLEARATAIKPPAGPELDVQLSGQKSLKEHER
jgi:hypothetical protein